MPLPLCPKCGWASLIYRDWISGLSQMRDWKCLNCKWVQSGDLAGAYLPEEKATPVKP